MARYKNKLLLEKSSVNKTTPEFKYIKKFEKIYSYLTFNQENFCRSNLIHTFVQLDNVEEIKDKLAIYSQERKTKLLNEIGEEISTCFIKNINNFLKTNLHENSFKDKVLLEKFKNYIETKSQIKELYNIDSNKNKKETVYNIKLKTEFNSFSEYKYKKYDFEFEKLFYAIEKELYWMKEVEKIKGFENKINLCGFRLNNAVYDKNNYIPCVGIIISVFLDDEHFEKEIDKID